MSCVDIMYQPYSSGFPYQRSSSEAAIQAFGVPRMHEPLDLGSYNTPASTSSAVKEEELDKDLQPKETHYFNANCVLLTYFTGETSTVVDEHFTRALSQASSFSSETQGTKNLVCKDGPLMSQRNFPPSFWNIAYQPSPSLSHHDFQLSSNPYFQSLHGISGLHQDPWHYPLSSQAHSYPHRTMHYDLSYPSMAGSSRFSPNYGSLLMNPSMRSSQFGSMSGQCDISKASSDHSRSRYTDPRLSSEFPSHTALPGLEGSLQEAGKDLYWF